ncbi:MAG: Bro-N domain-containing protein [Alphaproteobacteria bacterium]
MRKEPWFVAADVCRVLEIGNSRDAVSRLDDDEKSSFLTDVGTADAPVRKVSIINESGLYSLIMTSRKPAAKRFRKWVTADVLPSIRRTGRYEAPGQDRVDVNASTSTYEMTNWLRTIAECRMVHGQAAARWMWTRSPLPQPPADVSSAPMEDHPHPTLDPDGCLAHILTWRPDGTASVADLLARPGDADALGASSLLSGRRAPDAVAMLKRCGVHPAPKGWTGYVAIARCLPVLTKRFAGTPWARDWSSALLSLPGARRAPKVIWFESVSRAVLIPVALRVRKETSIMY